MNSSRSPRQITASAPVPAARSGPAAPCTSLTTWTRMHDTLRRRAGMTRPGTGNGSDGGPAAASPAAVSYPGTGLAAQADRDPVPPVPGAGKEACMREYSTPAVAEIPAAARLTDTVFARAEDSPGSVVIRRRAAQPDPGQPGWRDVTAAAFRDDVAAHAKGLIAAGIGAGDRVALLSRTRYEWTIADYAIWAAGAVTVPVYETSSAEQVEWILADSGARAIVVETPAHLAGIADVLSGRPAVSHVWLIDPARKRQPAPGRLQRSPRPVRP